MLSDAVLVKKGRNGLIRVLDVGDSWDENCLAVAFFTTLQKYQTDMAEEIMYDIQKNLYSMEAVSSLKADEALRWWRDNKEAVEEELFLDKERTRM